MWKSDFSPTDVKRVSLQKGGCHSRVWRKSKSKKKTTAMIFFIFCPLSLADPKQCQHLPAVSELIATSLTAIITVPPGDSMWPFDPPVGGHQQPLKGSLNYPKKVTIAELPGSEMCQLSHSRIPGRQGSSALKVKVATAASSDSQVISLQFGEISLRCFGSENSELSQMNRFRKSSARVAIIE